MKKNTATFNESLDLDMPDSDEVEIYSRRVASYSVEALRAAIPIDRIYVNHDQFVHAVKATSRIFHLAKETEIPQGMVLTGPPGVGKTAVFKFFRDSLPASSLFSHGNGAIGLRCPKRPIASHFIVELLRKYRYPFSAGTGRQVYARRGLAIDAIRQYGTRLIFIDEAIGLINSKASSKPEDPETDASEFIREIMDECNVGVVAAGPQELARVLKRNE